MKDTHRILINPIFETTLCRFKHSLGKGTLSILLHTQPDITNLKRTLLYRHLFHNIKSALLDLCRLSNILEKRLIMRLQDILHYLNKACISFQLWENKTPPYMASNSLSRLLPHLCTLKSLLWLLVPLSDNNLLQTLFLWVKRQQQDFK